MIKHTAKIALIWLLLGCVARCSDATSPEQLIRSLNREAEAAAEAKDVGKLKAMVSEDFKHEYMDRSSMLRLVQMYMLGHKSIYVLSLTKSLQVVNEDSALAEIVVAVASRPIEHVDRVVGLNADLLRFEVTYGRVDEDWKVVGISWQPAQVEDFL